MINNILNGIVSFILSVLGFIVGIILLPITTIITSAFPDLSEFISDINFFLNTYAFKGLAFGREIFFNISGASREIFGLLINFLFIRITIKLSIQAYKFMRNVWNFFHGE